MLAAAASEERLSFLSPNAEAKLNTAVITRERTGEHYDESGFLVDAELAEQEIERGGESRDVQTADGEDMRETARLYAVVIEVVDAALVADDEGAGDGGSVRVRVLVKEFRNGELHFEDGVGLACGEELGALRTEGVIGAAKRVGGEEGVERLMPQGGEVAFEHHYISRAEIRDIQARTLRP